MPTPTYTPLANITLGASAASVTFSSIPATYRDLVLVYDALGTSTGSVTIRLNSDSGSNYSRVSMAGDGSTVSSSAATTTSFSSDNDITTTARIITIFNLFDYAQTDKHKSALLRINRADSQGVRAHAGRWANTSAVTSIVIAGPLAATSTFALYGIAA